MEHKAKLNESIKVFRQAKNERADAQRVEKQSQAKFKFLERIKNNEDKISSNETRMKVLAAREAQFLELLKNTISKQKQVEGKLLKLQRKGSNLE